MSLGSQSSGSKASDLCWLVLVAYGDSPILPKPETCLPDPSLPYGLMKYAGEEYCRIFTSLYGLETVSLRYFNVFGPTEDPSSQYSGVLSRFITRNAEGRTPHDLW